MCSKQEKTDPEDYFWAVNKSWKRKISIYKQQPGAKQELRLIDTQLFRSNFIIFVAKSRSLSESEASKSIISWGINSIGQGQEIWFFVAIARQIVAKTDKSLEIPKMSRSSKFNSNSPFCLSVQNGPGQSRPENDILWKNFYMNI